MPTSRNSTRAPGLARRILRLAVRLAAGLAAAFAVLVVLYALLPPPSTLMIGRWLTLKPVARDWVALDAISPALVAAVVTSEDARFCSHYGVDTIELSEVVDAFMEGEKTRGASTITMQVAKNLFLWPSRSVIRKGLEIPMALVIDAIWSKRRIIEVYLNVAEWGDGVFGAEAGARRHFGKPARALTRREAALMAAALPNPIQRDAGRPGRRHAVLAARLAARASPDAPWLACLGLAR